jgi:RNA polymerase sigma-70 factor, ECF subfamily
VVVGTRWGCRCHSAYVRACVINHCNSWHRRRYTARRYEHLIVGPDGSDDRYDDLADTLAKLPRRRRVIVVLRFYEGMTMTEITDTLDVTEGTVKSSLHRALAQLKGVLQ